MTFNKASELKAHIGKKVTWEQNHDRHRGTYLVRSGTLEDVQGKNLLISGDYVWFPDVKPYLKILE